MNLKKLVIVIVVLVNLTEIRAAAGSKKPNKGQGSAEINIEMLKEQTRTYFVNHYRRPLNVDEEKRLESTMRPEVVKMAIAVRNIRLVGQGEAANNIGVSPEDVLNAVRIVATMEALQKIASGGNEGDAAGAKQDQK